jgi:hypothetical protein
VDASNPVLPLQRPAPSRRERLFPTLTAAQIARITADGRRRTVARVEVLVEVEDKTVPIFVVIGGDVQALRPSAGAGTLIVTSCSVSSRAKANMLDRDPDMRAAARSVSRERVQRASCCTTSTREHVDWLTQTNSHFRSEQA